jgi:hypothetical protein
MRGHVKAGNAIGEGANERGSTEKGARQCKGGEKSE